MNKLVIIISLLLVGVGSAIIWAGINKLTINSCTTVEMSETQMVGYKMAMGVVITMTVVPFFGILVTIGSILLQ